MPLPSCILPSTNRLLVFKPIIAIEFVPETKRKPYAIEHISLQQPENNIQFSFQLFAIEEVCATFDTRVQKTDMQRNARPPVPTCFNFQFFLRIYIKEIKKSVHDIFQQQIKK